MAMAPTTGTLQPKEIALKNVSELLTGKAMMAQLKLALPRHVTPERLARITLTEIRRTPKLLECTRESLFGAIMQAAQLGLEPGILGQCWIVPYGKDATFIPGYRGLAQLAYRSGQISSIAGRAVFDGDTFAYDFGSDTFTHKPAGETDPAKLTHVYAVIHTTNGGRLWDVMTRGEVEKIRTRSASDQKGSSPWKTDYAEMAKKTVLRRLFKIAPCSAEMNTAMQLDESADSGLPQGIEFSIPAEAIEEPTPTEAA
jgi:recombination protein RecT